MAGIWAWLGFRELRCHTLVVGRRVSVDGGSGFRLFSERWT